MFVDYNDRSVSVNTDIPFDTINTSAVSKVSYTQHENVGAP